jgi:hypothetical protein
VFDFLKKAARARWNEGRQPPEAPGSALPLNLRLGALVTIDRVPFAMLGDKTLLDLPEGAQTVEARGVVDLGEGVILHRFYLTDDLFIQVAVRQGRVEQIKLFQFFDTITPGSRGALEAWLKPGSKLGAARFDAGGKVFERCWGEEGDDYAPPVVFDETVYKVEKEADYDLTHYAMLYERELPGTERSESLLITVEDSGPNDFCIVTSIGLDLSPADLEIV